MDLWQWYALHVEVVGLRFDELDREFGVVHSQSFLIQRSEGCEIILWYKSQQNHSEQSYWSTKTSTASHYLGILNQTIVNQVSTKYQPSIST